MSSDKMSAKVWPELAEGSGRDILLQVGEEEQLNFNVGGSEEQEGYKVVCFLTNTALVLAEASGLSVTLLGKGPGLSKMRVFIDHELMPLITGDPEEDNFLEFDIEIE